MEGLAAARILAAAGAPLRHIAEALDRLCGDVDMALWALVGRTPREALLRLNGGGGGGMLSASPRERLDG